MTARDAQHHPSSLLTEVIVFLYQQFLPWHDNSQTDEEKQFFLPNSLIIFYILTPTGRHNGV
ncbi:hypothetical protein NIES39_D00550 [Arthrospira platensis NIES-39]|nr:hypothetical protein NIES39_D00550 [Arthrospira platensis NIES-39]